MSTLLGEHHDEDGPVTIESWSYRLQGKGGHSLDPASIAAIGADLVVVDYARDGTAGGAFTPTEVAAMQGNGADRKVVLSYISIGETEDFRSYWDPRWTKNGRADGALTAQSPDWLGPLDPDWPESRKVRYWDEDWQAIAFDWIETIAGQGFDGAYLDIVDAYYFWAHEVRAADRMAGDPATGSKAAARMIDFIVKLGEHARAINPDFVLVQQNAAFLLNDLVYDTGGAAKPDPARIAALHDAIAGIGVEDVYLRGGRDMDNPFRPDEATIRELDRAFGRAGELVLSVDYAIDPKLVDAYLDRAAADGFIPYAAPSRVLDQVAAHGTAEADSLRGDRGADRIYGLAGDDTLTGKGGRDVLLGNRGGDRLSGGGGGDTLHGNRGPDRLAGDGGNDRLAGGPGSDRFAFAPGDGDDRIVDFGRGDRIDLSAFGGSAHLRLVADGGDTLVLIGDVTIRLDHVARADLSLAHDFIL